MTNDEIRMTKERRMIPFGFRHSGFVICSDFGFRHSGFSSTTIQQMRYLLFILLLAPGCASYEYNVLRPQQLHVTDKPPVRLEQPPVTYDMVVADNDLVMTITNDTGDTLTLRADKSYVIDKTGASRAVRGMAIAPHSHIKFIFPPPKPYVRDDNPQVGFGFGAYDGGGMATGVGVGTGYGGGSVQNLDENVYWDWKGEGVVKFHFVFSDSKQTWEQDLIIDRKKK
jgi:hypothetical protein